MPGGKKFRNKLQLDVEIKTGSNDLKSRDSIIDELVGIIAEIAEVEPSEIGPETHFIKDLDMDSISSLEIVALLEKKYGMKITEEQLPSLATMTGLVELIANHFNQ